MARRCPITRWRQLADVFAIPEERIAQVEREAEQVSEAMSQARSALTDPATVMQHVYVERGAMPEMTFVEAACEGLSRKPPIPPFSWWAGNCTRGGNFNTTPACTTLERCACAIHPSRNAGSPPCTGAP